MMARKLLISVSLAVTFIASAQSTIAQSPIFRIYSGTASDSRLMSDDRATKKSFVEINASALYAKLLNMQRNKKSELEIILTALDRFQLHSVINTTILGDSAPSFNGKVKGGGAFSVVFREEIPEILLESNGIQFIVTAYPDGRYVVSRTDTSLLPRETPHPEVEPTQ